MWPTYLIQSTNNQAHQTSGSILVKKHVQKTLYVPQRFYFIQLFRKQYYIDKIGCVFLLNLFTIKLILRAFSCACF